MADIEASWATSEATRRTMRANRRRDTAPELALRRALHSRGYRYRVDYRPLPHLRRRADLVFTAQRVAVFVDGCFWHCCPEHGTTPKSNADYWIPKLTQNVERDRATDAELSEAGWKVVRVWEHESVEQALPRVAEAISGRS